MKHLIFLASLSVMFSAASAFASDPGKKVIEHIKDRHEQHKRVLKEVVDVHESHKPHIVVRDDHSGKHRNNKQRNSKYNHREEHRGDHHEKRPRHRHGSKHHNKKYHDHHNVSHHHRYPRRDGDYHLRVGHLVGGIIVGAILTERYNSKTKTVYVEKQYDDEEYDYLMDEHGNCYTVEYGRRGRILTEVPEEYCQP